MSEKHIDRHLLKKVLATTQTYGWVGAFRELGIEVKEGPTPEDMASAAKFGLGTTREKYGVYYYVKDRARFLRVLSARYGRDELLAALMEVEFA